MRSQREFCERLAALAKLTGFEEQLSPTIIGLYDKTLSKALGYELAIKAIDRIIVTRRGKDRFPSVADIIDVAKPKVDDTHKAVEAANRVIQAIADFGYPNAKAARAFIGEVGWYIVEKSGGWLKLCESMKESQLGTYRAQFRELALSAIVQHRAGRLHKPLNFDALEGHRDERGPTHIGKVLPETLPRSSDPAAEKKLIGGTHAKDSTKSD